VSPVDSDNERYCRGCKAWESKSTCEWCGDAVYGGHRTAHELFACLYHPKAMPRERVIPPPPEELL